MLERFIDGLRASSPAELVSVFAGLVYGVLAVRQDRRCWVFGGLSSAILAGLAAQARLPMQALLQVAYVLMSGYGFWHWSRAEGRLAAGAAGRVAGRAAAGGDSSAAAVRGAARQHAALAIGVWPWGVHVAIAGAIAAGTALLAPWVAEWTAAAWPRLDTATMLASLLATWMVARVRLENWLYWIVIDAVSLYLYAAQGLMFVAVLYLVYLVIAIFGWFEWRARLRRQSAAASA